MAQPINKWGAVRIMVMIRGPIRYGMQYSATTQFVSTTVLHLRRGFCTLVFFIYTCSNYKQMYINCSRVSNDAQKGYLHVLMKDEKERRKRQARSNKQGNGTYMYPGGTVRAIAHVHAVLRRYYAQITPRF